MYFKAAEIRPTLTKLFTLDNCVLLKDKNPYVNKVLDWKIKYEESDNPVIRASRALTDKVTDIMGGLFQKTELSETLTEICKLDPSFDRVQFLKDCEMDIIPNILEAMVRGNLEILKDWCHEAPYNLIAQPLKQAEKLGYHLDSKILGNSSSTSVNLPSLVSTYKMRYLISDINNVDLLMGKVMEQGTSFTNQLSVPADYVREGR